MSENEGTIFLYNGRYGVVTDKNGLYSMRARYYNVDIKRFINQDILTGDITDSPSLNRYAYCQGNPVNLIDPFGLSPEISWKSLGHAALDLLGFVPGVGAVADIVNAVWYAFEGDWAAAGMSLVAAMPGIGDAVGGFSKFAKAGKAIKTIGIGANTTLAAYNGVNTLSSMYDYYIVQGNKVGPEFGLYTASLYLDGKAISHGANNLNSLWSSKTSSSLTSTYSYSTDTSVYSFDGSGKSATKTVDANGNIDKANILSNNRAKGRAFEQQEFAKFSSQYSDAVEQITIKSSSGVKTRVDAIGLDSYGNVIIHEYKSSATAPLTKNQIQAFPDILDNGGVVVGKGKGIFIGGYQIPSGTKVKIIRP